jgi:hypothetical protein
MPDQSIDRGGTPVYRSITSVVALGSALIAAAPAWAGGRTERVSVDSGGVPGDDISFVGQNSMSWNGRFVAFASNSTNLVPDDKNGTTDVFVRDRRTGTTERVSRGLGGSESDGESGGTAMPISADGRIVVFASRATNLVPGDTNLSQDVFVYDRHTGRTERISVSSGGVQASGGFSFPRDVSADGRFVLFGSTASNLVDGDTNGLDDLFVRDRRTGRTERVNVSSAGLQGNGEVFQAAGISADGRFVAFGTSASNVVPGVGEGQVYIRDRRRGTTEALDIGPLLFGVNPALSATGRFVAFEGIDELGSDIYLHDRVTATTRLVTRGLNGERSNSGSTFPAISASGRYVAFPSDASNLVPDDANGATDVFRYDGVAGAIVRVSVANDGTEADGFTESFPAISSDGRTVGFGSTATNLVPDGGGGAFVRVLGRE